LRSTGTPTRRSGRRFAAYGLGGVIGTLIAFQLVKRMEPLVMASLAALGFAVPLWVLVARVPLAAIHAAIAFTATCGPLINAADVRADHD
jgi:predicted MFS family arabinose efflux permease